MMMCQQQTTRSLLSAGGPSSFTLSLSLSLSSLSFSLSVCVYVYIYIEQQYAFLPFLSVRSLKGRPSNKVWRVKDMCTTKISNTSKMNSRVCVFSLSISLSVWYCCVPFSSLLSFFAFWTVFPQELPL
jgi:hypothetical protein